MGNNSSKSKHRLQISGDVGGHSGGLEAAYGGGQGSPRMPRPKSAFPLGANLDHRLSLPATDIQPSRVQQQQQRQSPQVQPRQNRQQQRPHSMAPASAGTAPPPQYSAAAAAASANHPSASPVAAPALGNSTMTADVQLVLSQLIEKKPKYSLLRQLDFTELDDRARFVVFEAACDLLDQAKTIDSLREERRMMKSNLNVVRRVASIDHLDNSKHRRVASQELASCITKELQNKPPKLASPMDQTAADGGQVGGGLLGELVAAWQSLEKQFLESTRQELLSRRGLFPDSAQACRATHRLLNDMLAAAEALHKRRLDELVETVTSPTDARGMQVLRARLKLPTEESKAVRASAVQLLSQASGLCQLPWDSLVDASQYPAFRQAPSNVAGFLSNCSAWCWRAVCSNLGCVSLSCVEEGAPFRQELHRSELGLGVGRPVACCLWPVLYQNKTVICKALVQTGPVLGPIPD